MKIKKLLAASLTAMVLFGCSSGSKDEAKPKEEVKTEEPAGKEEDKEVDVVESFSGPAFKKDTMESVKNGNIPGNTIGDYAADLWILPSLQ